MIEAFLSVGSDELTALLGTLAQAARPAFRPDEELGVRVMGHLAFAGRRGASQRETARALAVAEASVSRRCDQLEAGGLIHRAPHPNDRRVKMLHLTPDGLAHLRLCASSTSTALGDALQDLSVDEKQVLARLAQRLASSAPERKRCAGCRIGGC